jgi:hypothetical protein
VSTAEWAAANSVSLVGRWAGGAFAEAARAYWRAWRARPDAATAPLPRLGLANGNSIAGSAQTVRDLLVEKVRQAPVNYVEATLAFGDLTPVETRASLAAFAETVMPAVREAAAARGEASVRSGEGF